MTNPSACCMASRAVLALAAASVLTMAVHPAEKNRTTQPAATLTNGTYRPFLINNIFNYYANNGDEAYNPFSWNNEGFEIPGGSDKHCIFESGILWGGMHKGRATPKVGGSVYRHALQAGPLLSYGTPATDPIPADPNDPKYRIYCVRPDIRPDIAFGSVESVLNSDEVPLIARYEPATARGLYDRYIADWNAWPADLGAPFTDLDKNGVYDPMVDVPGRPGADQTLWYVANDMNDSLTQKLAGCPPIGLEVQRTIWGHRGSGAAGTTIFTSTVIINKSGAPVDSMYITQWSDTDLGEAGDDLVGCDTTLDIAYTYNGRAPDATFGTTVPAAGFALLQGPMVPGTPTDTALFLSSRRPDSRNMRMTTFAVFTGTGSQYVDPRQGVTGDVQWYRVMRGTRANDGVPLVDPQRMVVTPFCVPGDPVKATDGSAGWVDGSGDLFMRDRRMAMSAGPFTLAAGDTQEVVIACMASQGADRLASITALRSGVRAVRAAFRLASAGRRMPSASHTVKSDSASAAIMCRIDARDDAITAASVSLTTMAGAEVATIALADDGQHADADAGDGIWGGTAHIPVRSSVLQGSAVLTYTGGEEVRWENVLAGITTVRLAVESFGVASDNINSDGLVNPGENVRYVFSLRNDSPVDLTMLNTRPDPFGANGTYIIPMMSGHAAFRPHYDPNDAATYFFFDVPAGYTDSTVYVRIVTTDDSLNVWHDTLAFPVKPLSGKIQNALIRHVAGAASGAYAIQVVDPAHVKDHVYVIRGADSAGAIGSYTLKDSTTGAVLIANHPIPDVLGHTSPVVDGFKVLRGTIDVLPGMMSWSVPSGTRRFSPVGGFSEIGLEGFSSGSNPTAYERSVGTIGAAMNLTFGGIRTRLGYADGHTVLLKLAAVDNVNLWDPKAVPTDANFSRAYRYLQGAENAPAKASFVPWIINPVMGCQYQDYNFSVPFSAWDMDVDPPQRLAVGHMENNVSAGLVDGRYWPGITTGSNSAARELAFIFLSPYTDTPDSALAVNLQNNATTPLMWVMACARRSEVPWVSGDQFMITAFHNPTSQDAWVFNPSVVAVIEHATLPTSFALLQNFPNPFNPSTTIRYEVPALSEVSITVYDVLGRAVRHLVNAVQSAGLHAVLWQGDNDAGIAVASGVYFYRCSVQRVHHNGKFEQTLKMILLR